MYILIFVLSVMIIIAIAIICVDSNRFHPVKYQIESDKLTKDFHFVFLSDLHNKKYGKDNDQLLQAIKKINPDAVLIGGDLLTAKPGKTLNIALNLIENIVNEFPVYYANGNHEQRLELYPEKYGNMAIGYENGLKRLHVSRLRNDKAELSQYNIQLVGCEINKQYYKRLSKVPMKSDYLIQLLPGRKPDSFTILLAHNPLYFDQYAEYGADLVLSGHVHGGIARVPFLGGVISTDFTLFPKYDGGYFHDKDSDMIISRGLGSHTIPFRFLNPGELVDVKLIAKKQA